MTLNVRAVRLDRRTLLTAAGGLGLGMTTVGGFAAADGVVRTPSLTILGEVPAQFSLLRAPGFKLGVLCGPPTASLLRAIGPLLGWTSPNLDVLAVMPGALTPAAGAWLAGQSPVRTLLVLGPVMPGQMPVTHPGVQVHVLTEPATSWLDPHLTVGFMPAFTTSVTPGPAESMGPVVTIQRGRQVIALVDDATALLRQPLGFQPDLIVVPGGDLRQVVATMRPQAVAVNGREGAASRMVPADLGLPDGRIAVVRTYLASPAVIDITSDALRLPDWTKMVTPAATPMP